MRTADMEPSAKMVKRTIFGVLTPMMIGVSIVIGGLVKLTVIDHQKYAELANRTHFTNRTITANRGGIYDSAGAPLAWSATVYKIYMDPTLYRSEMDEIEEKMAKRQERLDAGEELPEGTLVMTRDELEEEIVRLLSSKLKISEDTVLTAMEKENRYSVLQTQVEKTTADEILTYFSELGMNSITTEEDSKRYYPQNDLAAQVIGFTNSDGDGLYGLEAYYDDYLSGINGRTTTAKDAQGNIMPYRYEANYPAQDGASLYLTLDSTLQYILEKNLQEMCEKFQVRDRACGIIMNAKTGAVYAMGTWPTFDLNDPTEIYNDDIRAELEALPEEEYQESYITAREQQWKNKAITELYVPGSVFKIFTASAAIEEQAIDWQHDYFYCSGEYAIKGAEPIHCHLKSGHGSQSFQEALTNSCNPAFIEVGRRLGIHKFCTYFSSFGLTEKTGIDLPGETSSIYVHEDDMRFVNLASSAFGQTNVLTPIEMITGIAASINGGYLVQPHVVDKIVSSDGNVIKTFSTNIKRQVISEETSVVMRQLLQSVVDAKEGANAHIDGYAIGGKSGTSQKIINNKVSDNHYVASYTCFAPANDPEIVLLVMADDPNPSIDYYGSKVAAPTARDIMEEALPYLGFYPAYTEEERARLDVTVPLLINAELPRAEETLAELGLEYEAVGTGSFVVAQCPTTGSGISAGGKVILYTEEDYSPEMVEMPDLIGYTAEDANAVLVNRGLNYVAVGAYTDEGTLVQDQSVEAGTMVEVGTVVQLTYLVDAGQSG